MFPPAIIAQWINNDSPKTIYYDEEKERNSPPLMNISLIFGVAISHWIGLAMMIPKHAKSENPDADFILGAMITSSVFWTLFLLFLIGIGIHRV